MPLQRLDTEDTAWIDAYAANVVGTFAAKFAQNTNRFPQGDQLIARFKASVEQVLQRGRRHFRTVNEAHNELCVADALLNNQGTHFHTITYEARLDHTEKSIDFRAEAVDCPVVFVDVKTIKPVAKDRWEQYERAIHEGWFPKNIAVLLDKQWLGGELWHYAFAARGRILEYAVDLEQKIAGSGLSGSGAVFVLALCGEGFYRHQDELEDFVAFYCTGTHRSDDPFSLAEENYIKERGISISRTVSRFACMRRSQGEMLHKRLNWHVQPPADPAFF